MSRSATKANRLLQIEAILLAHPEGMSPAEIARRLGVNRSTIGRYIPDLPANIYLDDLDGGKWKIDRRAYLINLRLNLHEALAVHLATRLLASRLDRQNPHAAAALRKLGLALEPLAPQVSRHVVTSADVLDDQSQRYDPDYIRVLETLTNAWASQTKVQIWHRHRATNQIHSYEFAPYFIEPYAVGQSIHVIGWRRPPDALRTFNIARIEKAKLLPERYSIPDDFDPRALLAEAWGIWYTEEEPVEVVLRFSPKVAGRVRETLWHRSENLEESSGGHIVWKAQVAAPQEMVPWIRGWGADVEVLAPASLRQQLINEARRYVNLYLTSFDIDLPDYLLPFAKTDKDKINFHRLLYHLIDVSAVAQAMWQAVLPLGQKKAIAELLSLDLAETGRLMSFLIGLHDIGKASPGFQTKYAPAGLRRALEAAGLSLSGYSSRTMMAPHGLISAQTLESILPDGVISDVSLARKIARALGGHHGVWPHPSEYNGLEDDTRWQAVRTDIYHQLVSLHQPPKLTSKLGIEAGNAFLILLSGFASVADWVGSMEDYFDFEENTVPPHVYAKGAAEKAARALRELGWVGWQPDGERLSFAEMFPFEPRPLQQAVINLAENLSPPALLILEAPTGIGKTEVALFLADSWLQSHQGRGIYVAMPTQATSNQMFARTGHFLRHRYPHHLVNLQLLHSQSRYSEALQEIVLHRVGEDERSGIAAMGWFNRRSKRTLLAPFGIGTVDQVLLGVLQTKHFFVRLFGLSRKVVIFDEVHAYDIYMNTIFFRLLDWLRSLGTSVIILSATLPRSTIKQIIEAYGREVIPLPDDYPSLTAVTADLTNFHSLPPPADYTLMLDWSLSREVSEIADYLRRELTNGGCAAIICNTVARAQDIYSTLKLANLVDEDNLILFHARFPPVWKQAIEEKVLGKFGRQRDDVPVHRPQRAIVVATQVIEQSLDLDFDLMISDLAPVDLLMQRAGRLHRHHRPDRPPLPRRLTVIKPEVENGRPAFGPADVYTPYLLHRTYALLGQRTAIVLPSETRQLVEAVYNSEHSFSNLNPSWQAEIERAFHEDTARRHNSSLKAARNLIARPSFEGLLNQANLALEEDNPDVHNIFRAQTRDIDLGLRLVCLFQFGPTVHLDPSADSPAVDLSILPDPQLLQDLQLRAITIHHRGIVDHLLRSELPQGWLKSSVLRHMRLATFSHGRRELSGTPFTLLLDRELGLIIQKETK